VSKVTEKIKTRSKPTPSENFNSHPLIADNRRKNIESMHEVFFLLIESSLP
jgi:hypothetical protein